jgi:Immunoglobulin domain
MKTLWQGSSEPRRAWWLLAVLLVLCCREVSAQSIMISNYTQLRSTIVNTTASVITNFQTNITITLTSSGQTIPINHSVLIDGGTNGVVIDASGLTRIFTIATNCQVVLNNLQLINGTSTNGGGIYNNGTLIISNCILAGNSATNVTGVNGTTNSSSDGGNGGNGGTALGGAIYSRGPVSIYYSVVGTNNSLGGNGGTGGTGGSSLLFGYDGGNAGSGGGAYGAAIYCASSSNVFVSSQFFDNACTAGSAGSGGSPGSGSFPGYGGAGASGGSAAGGAVYVAPSASVFVTNCVFSENVVTAGASGTDSSGNNNGFNGGSAQGGGIFITAGVANAYFENTVFFGNTCTGGVGGSVTVGTFTGGNGGSALGGGLASDAAMTIVQNCTLATNTLAVGAAGTGTSGGGSSGTARGWDLGRSVGAIKLFGSILSGGTNTTLNTMPNAYGVTDAGYNISSDSSLARASDDTITNTNPQLDSGLASYGGPYIGPFNLLSPPAFQTLAIVDGTPATNFVPGVPGLSFPATDELGNARGSPTSAGDYELNPITIDSNAPPPDLGFVDTASEIKTSVGDTVTLTVSATNNDTANNLGYQWQLNGTNLPENKTFVGTTTSNLTVKNMAPAETGAYQVIVGVSILESVATSSVVSVVIISPAEIKTQPVSKRDVPNGAVVTFSVTATGGPLPTYQWYETTPGGTTEMLTDTNGISGSTNSELVIDPATSNNVGSYFVVVSNQYKTVTSVAASLSIAPDTTDPKVTLLTPLANARTTNFVITGTAYDNAQVVQVNYLISNKNDGSVISNIADLSTNGTTTKNWTISTEPDPGTNFVTVQSVNYSGRLSALATREFFYEVPAPFTLQINGSGTVRGSASVAGGPVPTNSAMLNIGEAYTLTAVPAKNYLFSNWVSVASRSAFISNSTSLHFIMRRKLTIFANFSTNLFLGAAGTYNGLFYGQQVTEQTAGMLQNLTVRSTGSYSGNLLLGGSSYPLTGSFDSSGIVNTSVKRATDEGPVNLDMMLNWTNGQITGSVSGSNFGGWNSPLLAKLSASSSPSAEYTVVLSPGTNAVGDIPPGFGYMLITNHNGSVTLSGALADSTSFNQSPRLASGGAVPVYASLYGKTGLLLGWLSISNGTISAETPLAWIKPTASSGIYSAGFTNLLLATGSAWTNPPVRDPALALADGTLSISNTGAALDFPIAITNDVVVKTSTTPTNSLTGTIAPKTGLLQITFGNGAGKATTVGYGVMLQDSTNGAGFFVTKTNAGAILLTPN